MGVTGAAVFFDVARYQGALQTNCARRRMGSHTTSDHDADLYLFFWEARARFYRRRPRSNILLHGIVAVVLLLKRSDKRRKQPGGQQQPDYQGVLPEIDNTVGGGGSRVA